MPKYKLVIFDFDGTLANSLPWFIENINKVAEKYKFNKIEESEYDTLRTFNRHQILKYVQVSKWKIPFIARYLRRLMNESINQIQLFDGIENLLSTLHNNKVKLSVVSSNSRDNITHVLGNKNSSLIDHFECNASLFGKPRKIKKVLKKYDIENHEVILIGDEIRDIYAAKKTKIASGAVAWGYNNIASLKQYQPDQAFENINDIISEVCGPTWTINNIKKADKITKKRYLPLHN